MAIVTVGAKGRVLPDEVWDRYRDISRWPEWAPQISRVDATDDHVAFGVTGTVVGPFGVSVDFVIETVDEQARRWTWTVRRWPVTIRLEHAVTKRGGGSATSLRLDGPLPVVVAYAPLARLALQRLVSKDPPVQYVPDRDADGNLRE
ncbi:Polyketide cyclase / dehydrase and lipid transport [Jatrophihabitans endophyticus]|uniref:Polyketide cyclase / dehydrase and lipid transport n=1 Tax=Jatrophihabitans endophyticus TaxID=1206085 RepID=A0A1M5C8Y2_9ACTN|nr:SRPBCC family protein [Jatrophihabitans endophyticus]SHF51244.1 Polyketide cyclase / dehydrase and lipid transport [Jatrophihabitans endophyticus]